MANDPQSLKKKSAVLAVENDNKYGIVVALIVVLVLFGGLALYFFIHHKGTASAVKENYLALPQLIVDNGGQVVRLSVSVQVDEEDKDWMVQKKNEINQIFRKTVNELDPQNFRSGAGRVAVQEEVRDQLNQQLHVTKIKAILYTNLIMQDKIIE